jgi:hypothetical protein
VATEAAGAVGAGEAGEDGATVEEPGANAGGARV